MKTKTILEFAYWNDQVSPMGDLTLKRLVGLVDEGLLITRPNNKFWISEKGLKRFLRGE